MVRCTKVRTKNTEAETEFIVNQTFLPHSRIRINLDGIDNADCSRAYNFLLCCTGSEYPAFAE